MCKLMSGNKRKYHYDNSHFPGNIERRDKWLKQTIIGNAVIECNCARNGPYHSNGNASHL